MNDIQSMLTIHGSCRSEIEDEDLFTSTTAENTDDLLIPSDRSMTPHAYMSESYVFDRWHGKAPCDNNKQRNGLSYRTNHVFGEMQPARLCLLSNLMVRTFS
jgi:hypothetical protein